MNVWIASLLTRVGNRKMMMVRYWIVLTETSRRRWSWKCLWLANRAQSRPEAWWPDQQRAPTPPRLRQQSRWAKQWWSGPGWTRLRSFVRWRLQRPPRKAPSRPVGTERLGQPVTWDAHHAYHIHGGTNGQYKSGHLRTRRGRRQPIRDWYNGSVWVEKTTIRVPLEVPLKPPANVIVQWHLQTKACFCWTRLHSPAWGGISDCGESGCLECILKEKIMRECWHVILPL